jgi:hypothetical protein
MEGDRLMSRARTIAACLLAVVSCACRGSQAPPVAGGDAVRPDGAASAAEPSAVLYGRVVGSDQTGATPRDWQARVTAEYEDGSDVAPRDRDSNGDLFAFKVVPGKRVRLYFEAVPYQAAVSEYIDVTADRSYAWRLPDVVMDRIRWSMALFANGNGEAFARNLDQQAALAETTGSADIFRANLEFYRRASAKFPDCLKKLQEFERTPRAQAISRQAEARGVPVTLLQSLVTAPAELAASQPETLRSLAANPRVAQTLRNEARRALEGRPAGMPPPPAPPSPATERRTPRR